MRREQGAAFLLGYLLLYTEFPAWGIQVHPTALPRLSQRWGWAGEHQAALLTPTEEEALTVEVTFLNPCFGQTFPISAEEKPASSSFLSLLSIFLPSSPG